MVKSINQSQTFLCPLILISKFTVSINTSKKMTQIIFYYYLISFDNLFWYTFSIPQVSSFKIIFFWNIIGYYI